ncbi:MAG: twin-arginine translocase subunit TatC [Verrucomicrobia bacterium]|nr:twin-arginine translocase subunit TatC [Verrucomicrobiota bacterium]
MVNEPAEARPPAPDERRQSNPLPAPGPDDPPVTAVEPAAPDQPAARDTDPSTVDSIPADTAPAPLAPYTEPTVTGTDGDVAVAPPDEASSRSSEDATTALGTDTEQLGLANDTTAEVSEPVPTYAETDRSAHDTSYADSEYHDAHQYHSYDSALASTTDDSSGVTPPVGGGDRGPGPEEPEAEEEEDGGGPVKSFLEHLEDLRWTLIRCAVALGIGFLVCLIAGDRLMVILKWPLERSALARPGKNYLVVAQLGTNRFGPFRLTTNQIGSFDLGTNHYLTLDVGVTQIGTNHVLTIHRSPKQPAPHEVPTPVRLLNLSPAGGFFVAFQLAIYGGIVLAAPFIIFFIAQFVLPALKIKEKKYLLRGFAVGSGLFFLGVGFCYFVLMPLALNASAKYSEWLGIGADQWTAEQYISFVSKFMLGMGLGFQMPVVILFLVKIGILDYSSLKKLRPYMVVINLVLGAVLTTPEVLTQVMMFIPLQFLYEVSVWIAWYWERRDRKRELAGAQERR